MLYTYGGFHSSALSFIDKLAAGCDRAVALVPLADWKDDLKDRIAVCVQRHTADIVIDDALVHCDRCAPYYLLVRVRVLLVDERTSLELLLASDLACVIPSSVHVTTRDGQGDLIVLRHGALIHTPVPPHSRQRKLPVVGDCADTRR